MKSQPKVLADVNIHFLCFRHFDTSDFMMMIVQGDQKQHIHELQGASGFSLKLMSRMPQRFAFVLINGWWSLYFVLMFYLFVCDYVQKTLMSEKKRFVVPDLADTYFPAAVLEMALSIILQSHQTKTAMLVTNSIL